MANTGHWQFSTGCIESGQSQKQQHNSTKVRLMYEVPH